MQSASSAGASKRGQNNNGADEEDGGALQRKRLPGPFASQQAHRKRDDTFWYPDGNLIVRVGGTVFKLHRSRLARYCAYFKNLFESGISVNEHIERCPVYNAPEDLMPEVFKDLLTAIETPLENLKSRLSASNTVSLLEAAVLLSCGAVLRLAKNRMYAFWDSRLVPEKLGLGDIRSYTTTIATIHLARNHNIPSLLKRTFYELLSSEEYWDVYHTDRASIDLCSTDRERLLFARDVLGKLWREFILTVPDMTIPAVNRHPVLNNMCCHPCGNRGDIWRSYVIEKGDLERGGLDPLRNKESAWKVKRVEWWEMLDGLFKL
ncbi:hypothetical protein LXA43DRAFT_1095288 [Ganoderma leucocontextum]|nr:hypothetical protein LXA43DRAFT_1095288 [Ganoderma leucocontextum]